MAGGVEAVSMSPKVASAGRAALTRDSGTQQENLHAVFERRERQMEQVACRVRIGVGLIACGADGGASALVGIYSVAALFLVVGLAYAGLMLWLHRLLGRARYRGWIKYATTALDFAVFTSLTVVYMGDAGELGLTAEQIGSTMIALLPVINLLSAMRVGLAIIATSTALAMGALVVIGLRIMLPLGAIAYYLGIIAASGLLAWIISRSTAALLLRFARRNQLTRFLPRQMVEQVDRGELDLLLGGHDQTVTVLMSDIRGFTSLSETRSPAQIVAQLNEYFTAMSRVVHRHGGSIDKFIGDAILAVFGVPEPKPDDATCAVQAAHDMLSALDGLNAAWAQRGLPMLRIGIGLHSGEAVAGNIGSPERMDYTVIGDTVNVASRIEGLTKQYATPLLISEATRVAAGDFLSTELVDDAPIRGRRGTIRLYAPARNMGSV